MKKDLYLVLLFTEQKFMHSNKRSSLSLLLHCYSVIKVDIKLVDYNCVACLNYHGQLTMKFHEYTRRYEGNLS